MQVTVNVDQVGSSTAVSTIRNHAVLVDRPEKKGGADAGPMGGELLLASLGGCFISNLLEAIRTREADISSVNVDVIGTFGGSPTKVEGIDMNVSAITQDKELLEKLVLISERSCIVANTLKGAVDLNVSVV